MAAVYILSFQFRDDLFKMIPRTMEVGEGTSEELVAEEEGNRRNIDALVQKPHREGVSEAMEGDMLSDTGGRDELWDLMVQDRRGQSGEDGSFLLDSPKNGYCLLGKGRLTLYPVFLMVKFK